MTILRALAFLLICTSAVHASAVPAESLRRSEVDAVARAIEKNYFDAERGKRIADDLRSDAAEGAFDTLATPEALAQALTAQLKPLDRHFRVQRSTDGAETGVSQAAAPMRMRRPAARTGDASPAASGIRSAEVLPGNVGVLGISSFADFEFRRAGEPARAAVDAALRRLSHTDAVIVDLRGNRGGSPAMVGYLVSAFTPRNAPIYNVFHSRAGNQTEAPAEWYPAPRVDVPLYVLIDGRTGSAAESFAYTLKHARRATIVGEPSGGAANPGQYFAAGHGLSVFVPTGSPVNPITGGNWEGTGVTPDIAAASPAALDTALALARKATAR
jgi:hypothetical protein